LDTSPESKSSTRSVWKFPIPESGPDVFSIEMPSGAEILTIQVQQGHPQMWALVTPGVHVISRIFRIAGTGHPIDDGLIGYIGTFQWGSLVFHIFEIAAAAPTTGDGETI
jgi:hypothetical protein